MCGDCNSNGSNWISLNLGVFMCSKCAHGHRHMGPTVTKVKSTTLDKWKMEYVTIMENTGN